MVTRLQPSRLLLASTLLAVSAGITGCGVDTSTWDEALGQRQQALTVPGPWQIPGDVLAIGDTQDVTYTGAGPWVGSSGCYGSMSPGASEMREFLYQAFPQLWHVGGYACRSIRGNDSVMSVHATGRALDLHVELEGGDADNGAGDPVGNWLIVHAEEIGIQYIIWDQWTWGAHRDAGSKERAYGGLSPHKDHLHIELSVPAGERETAWFAGSQPLPENPDCAQLAAGGGVIDDGSACVNLFGPSQYWRFVDGAGHGGSLFWTNAFENDRPSNWARWTVKLAEAGDYRVEVHIDPSWGVYDDTRYGLRHDGVEETIYLNQGQATGWTELGTFAFAASGEQHLSLYDDVTGAVASDQHIVADAIRLTRVVDPTNPPATDIWELEYPEPDMAEPSLAQIPDPVDPMDPKGCSSAAGSAGLVAWLSLALFLGLGGLRRRRR